MKDACRNCKFWEHASDGEGVCRRYPPVIDTLVVNNTKEPTSDFAEESILFWSFPSTSEMMWCGEHLRSNV